MNDKPPAEALPLLNKMRNVAIGLVCCHVIDADGGYTVTGFVEEERGYVPRYFAAAPARLDLIENKIRAADIPYMREDDVLTVLGSASAIVQLIFGTETLN
jgi:hypothetical protein